VERVVFNALVRLCRLTYYALGDSFCHWSELSTASLRPAWHFSGKPIRLAQVFTIVVEAAVLSRKFWMNICA